MAEERERREKLNVRMPPSMIEKIDAAAEKETRTRTSMVEHVLKQWLLERGLDATQRARG